MSNFGYLIIINDDNSEVDYTKLAYSLAISIKTTQKEGYDQIALVTNKPEKVEELNSPWVFNHVITQELEPGWDGRSRMDLYTPFDNTVCLDADMLFSRDYSHWVDYFIENSELYIPATAYTYRGKKITGDFYRKAFVANDLPNLYSFYTFFKKDSELAKEFFTLNRYIIRYNTEFSNTYLDKFKPKVLGTDEAFALSASLLGIEDQISYPLEFPRVVHMKPMIQDWPWPADSWTDHIGFYFNKNNQIKLGNSIQHDILHYVDKTIITDEIISLQEERLWNNK
jgi:hypothetical protein